MGTRWVGGRFQKEGPEESHQPEEGLLFLRPRLVSARADGQSRFMWQTLQNSPSLTYKEATAWSPKTMSFGVSRAVLFRAPITPPRHGDTRLSGVSAERSLCLTKILLAFHWSFLALPAQLKAPRSGHSDFLLAHTEIRGWGKASPLGELTSTLLLRLGRCFYSARVFGHQQACAPSVPES